MKKRVVAIIQARVGSTRLPGKIFKIVSGKPMLEHMINRALYSKMLDDIVLAIPDSYLNDELAEFAGDFNINCFRGNEDDVLSRYYNAASKFKGEVVVRLTSDCPLIDSEIIDSTVRTHLDGKCDYTYKGPNSGFPRGVDTEVFNFETLEKVYKEAKLKYEREHVTPYIYTHPEIFKINLIKAEERYNYPQLRLTVDTEEDLTLIRTIYENLYPTKQNFCLLDIINFLAERPDLVIINAYIKQKKLGE